MADMEVASQERDKPVTPAPVEPDIDSLLPNIPEFGNLFATQEPGTVPEQPKPAETPPKEAPQPEPGAPETAEEVTIPEGLKPQGEEKPLEPEKKEEPTDKVQKRIDELTAKRKAAEEKAASLQTELADLKAKFSAPPPLAPGKDSPLSDVLTFADLVAKKGHIEEAKKWAFQNLDGGQVSDGKGGTQWLDGVQVKSIYATADEMLTKHIPERADWIKNKQAFDNDAKRQYPALFKEGTEPNKEYRNWLTVFPECQRYPDIALIVGDALVGRQIRLQRQKGQSANGNSHIPQGQQPLAAPAPAASPRVPQNKVLSGEALSAAFKADPSAALDNFVGGLLDSAAAQRAR